MYQQAAIEILTRRYGDFDPGMIFMLEVVLSGLARNDAAAVAHGMDTLDGYAELLNIERLAMADIVRMH